jgi:hypothetical protein
MQLSVHDQYKAVIGGSITEIVIADLEALVKATVDGSLSILKDTQDLVSYLPDKDKYLLLDLRHRWRAKMEFCLSELLIDLLFALRHRHMNTAMELRASLLRLLKKHETYKRLLELAVNNIVFP